MREIEVTFGNPEIYLSRFVERIAGRDLGRFYLLRGIVGATQLASLELLQNFPFLVTQLWAHFNFPDSHALLSGVDPWVLLGAIECLPKNEPPNYHRSTDRASRIRHRCATCIHLFCECHPWRNADGCEYPQPGRSSRRAWLCELTMIEEVGKALREKDIIFKQELDEVVVNAGESVGLDDFQSREILGYMLREDIIDRDSLDGGYKVAIPMRIEYFIGNGIASIPAQG